MKALEELVLNLSSKSGSGKNRIRKSGSTGSATLWQFLLLFEQSMVGICLQKALNVPVLNLTSKFGYPGKQSEKNPE